MQAHEAPFRMDYTMQELIVVGIIMMAKAVLLEDFSDLHSA